MTDQAIAILTLAASILASAALYFFKSPKEFNGELAAALRDLTTDHELLARRFERHDVAMQNLTQAVERLTNRLERMEPHMAKPPRGHRGG